MTEITAVIDIRCDHDGRPDCDAAPAIVERARRVEHLDDDGNLWDGWLAAGGALQTVFSEAARLRTSDVTTPREWIREFSAASGLLVGRRSGRAMAAMRWRLHCDDCGDTLPLTATNLVPVLDRLAASGVAQVSLSQLRRVTRP